MYSFLEDFWQLFINVIRKKEGKVPLSLSGCQPKTFKTFILMVKPLKPFFSQKNL